LNKNLLVLAKMDSNTFAENEQINVSDIIQLCWSNVFEQAETKRLLLQIKSSAALIVTANRGIVEILFNNLLSNAINHNSEGGRIDVQISENKISISNTGVAMPLPADKLFTRFQTINKTGKGNGLGLAIVAAICNKYGWGIDYHYKNGQHFFTVSF
jgi:two-component system sensor histidine kinase QseC